MIHTLVIGSGFTGVASTVRLLESSTGPATVTLVERNADWSIGGLAYSKATAASYHEANVAARTMALFSSNPTELAADLQISGHSIPTRWQVGDFLERKLNTAVTVGSSHNIAFNRAVAKIDDLVEDNTGVTAHALDAERFRASRVILATGNLQQRELNICTKKMTDPHFAARFVKNQWLPEGKAMMASIPKNAPVLILGTALSAFDSARTLLRQGHEGKIVMFSRHGHEHYRYPKEIKWPDLTLPEPRFIQLLRAGCPPEAVVNEMLTEFRELTGITIDLAKNKILGDSWLTTHFNDRTHPLPEQVLKQWEKHIPKVVQIVGHKKFGEILRSYSSLISVLRIGVGNNICEELEGARKSGQLCTVAGDLYDFVSDPHGIEVEFARLGECESEKARFGYVISSLGPDYDYSRINDPLWQNIIARGYTTPHSSGIGITVDHQPETFGRLSGSKRLFGSGVPAAGVYITERGVIGPLATAIPGMRGWVEETAMAVMHANDAELMTLSM